MLKVADSVLFVISVADDFINDDGETLLQAAFSQGLPTPVLVATDLADLPIKVSFYSDCIPLLSVFGLETQ